MPTVSELARAQSGSSATLVAGRLKRGSGGEGTSRPSHRRRRRRRHRELWSCRTGGPSGGKEVGGETGAGRLASAAPLNTRPGAPNPGRLRHLRPTLNAQSVHLFAASVALSLLLAQRPLVWAATSLNALVPTPCPLARRRRTTRDTLARRRRTLRVAARRRRRSKSADWANFCL